MRTELAQLPLLHFHVAQNQTQNLFRVFCHRRRGIWHVTVPEKLSAANENLLSDVETHKKWCVAGWNLSSPFTSRTVYTIVPYEIHLYAGPFAVSSESKARSALNASRTRNRAEAARYVEHETKWFAVATKTISTKWRNGDDEKKKSKDNRT